MAHIRRPLGTALIVNTAVLVGEAVAGFRGNSLALLTDAAHNLSDELGLLFLFLAFVLTVKASRGFQRVANVFNSLGLIAISATILWQAIARLENPPEVVAWLPVTVGVAAAAGNWAVARILRPWHASNAAIRLAYIHNLGDVYVSLAPVAAGALVILTGRSVFDPLLAGAIASWLIFTTVSEIRQSRDELLWPEDAACPHEAAA